MLLLIHALFQILAKLNHVGKRGPCHMYLLVYHTGITQEVPQDLVRLPLPSSMTLSDRKNLFKKGISKEITSLLRHQQVK